MRLDTPTIGMTSALQYVEASGRAKLRTTTPSILALCILSTISAPAQTFSTQFTFNYADGGSPRSGLVQGADGNRQATITVTLTSSPHPSSSGQSVKFTATLTSDGSIPNGQIITFSVNGRALGTATISGGKATFSTTALPVGSDSITATYAGDSNYSSVSTSTTQVVN